MKKFTAKYIAFALPLLFLPLLSPIPTAHAQADDLIYESKANPRPFRGKARLVTLKRDSKLLHVTTVYPQFLHNTRLTRFANRTIRGGARTNFNDFVKSFAADQKEGIVRKELPYEYSELPFLTYYLPSRIISTSIFSGQYRGGAHGMEGTYTTNFGFLKGMRAPKVLTLGNLFNGTTYRKEVEQKLFDKFRADMRGVPTFVKDGSVKSLTSSQLNNFTISSKGLTWYFPAYQLGPYAEGQPEYTLSPNELGPNFKRAAVLGK